VLVCACVYLPVPGECPPSSYSDKWKERVNWYKHQRKLSVLISLPEISRSLLGHHHYEYNKSNGRFTMLFAFIACSRILVGHRKVWSLSSVRIILSSGQGDFK